MEPKLPQLAGELSRMGFAKKWSFLRQAIDAEVDAASLVVIKGEIPFPNLRFKLHPVHDYSIDAISNQVDGVRPVEKRPWPVGGRATESTFRWSQSTRLGVDRLQGL